MRCRCLSLSRWDQSWPPLPLRSRVTGRSFAFTWRLDWGGSTYWKDCGGRTLTPWLWAGLFALVCRALRRASSSSYPSIGPPYNVSGLLSSSVPAKITVGSPPWFPVANTSSSFSSMTSGIEIKLGRDVVISGSSSISSAGASYSISLSTGSSGSS